MNGEQVASMEAWGAMTDAEQTEIVNRAAKKAVYQAGAYGVVITPDELIGETWLGIVKRLDADRLSKANGRRAAEDKAPLTIIQIAHRAAHTAVELDRYDRDKHNALPLEVWGAVDDESMEARIIDRLTVEGFATGRDATDKLIIEMLPQGYTERQIGAPAGMSGPAIHKRITKIRNALKEVIA